MRDDDEIEVEGNEGMTQLRGEAAKDHDMITAEREQARQTWLKLECFCKKFTHDPVLSEPKIIMYDQVPIWLNVTPTKDVYADAKMRKGKRGG